MTISSNYVPLRQLGNGATLNFSANWNALSAAWLSVNFEDVATGVLTPQPSGWSAVVADSGFTVTFVVPPPSTVYVVIGRDVDQNQTEPYRTSKGFQGEVIEGAFDKLTAMIQDQQDAINRALKFQLGSAAVGTISGSPVDQATIIFSGVNGDMIVGPTAGQIAGAQAAAQQAIAAAAIATAALGSVTYIWCGTAGGTANALTLTTGLNLTSLQPGFKFRFLVNATNTLADVTCVVDSVPGTPFIRKDNGNVATASLAYGDLLAGMIAEIEWDGTRFQFLNAYAFGENISSIAAAATLDLSAADIGGDFITVTGNTTITAVTLARGQRRAVRFTGTPQITNGASLVMPGGANIQIVAGDIVTFRRIGSVVYAEVYQPYVNISPFIKTLLDDADAAAARATLGVTSGALGSRTSADINYANTNTLVDVTGLTLNLLAGQSYDFSAFLDTTSANNAGVSVAIGGTAVLSAIAATAQVQQGTAFASPTTSRVTAKSTRFGDVTAVTTAKISINGSCVCTTSGTLTIMFAQNAAQASNTTLLSGASFNATAF